MPWDDFVKRIPMAKPFRNPGMNEYQLGQVPGARGGSLAAAVCGSLGFLKAFIFRVPNQLWRKRWHWSQITPTQLVVEIWSVWLGRYLVGTWYPLFSFLGLETLLFTLRMFPHHHHLLACGCWDMLSPGSLRDWVVCLTICRCIVTSWKWWIQHAHCHFCCQKVHKCPLKFYKAFLVSVWLTIYIYIRTYMFARYTG